MCLPAFFQVRFVGEPLEMSFLESSEVRVDLEREMVINQRKKVLEPYHALRHTWRETHLVTGLHLVEEVCPTLEETEDSIQEAVDSLTGLLGDSEKEVVVPLVDRVGCHIYVYDLA
jgi:hypothetical protein